MNKKRNLYKMSKDNASLPTDRKELFKTILKEDFLLLLQLGILFLLFSFPLFLIIGIQYFLLLGIKEITISNVFPLAFYGGIISIPCFMISYLGKYSCFNILKKRAHNEGFLLGSEFIKGIKENLVNALISGLFTGISCFILEVGIVFLITNFENNFSLGIGIGVLIIQFFLIYMANEYIMIMSPIYVLKYFSLFKNGFAFTFADFFINVFYFLLMVAIPISISFINFIAYPIVIFIFSIFIMPILFTFLTLRGHFMLDKYVNSIHYPDYVNKGLKK